MRWGYEPFNLRGRSHTGELRGRARVVYCSAVGDRKFIVGLNFLRRSSERVDPASPSFEQIRDALVQALNGLEKLLKSYGFAG